MPPDGLGSTGNGSASSNIRVFVRWHEQVVFAGEEVKCTITFKNVARPPGGASSALSTPTALKPPAPLQSSSRHPGGVGGSGGGGGGGGERGPRQLSPLHHGGAPGRGKHSAAGLAPPPSARGHRSTLSLSVPSAASRARAGSVSWSPPPLPPPSSVSAAPGNNAAGGRAQRNGSGSGHGHGHGHGHKRSVSIVSIGSLSTVDDAQSVSSSSPKPNRPRGHARASSLQIIPRGGLFNGPRSATHPRIPMSQSSPLFHSSYPPERSINGRLPGTATAPDTPRVGFPRGSPASPNPLSEFRFPMSPAPPTPGTTGEGDSPSDGGPITSPTSAAMPTRPRDPVPTINEQVVAPSARVLSTTSIAGTPRSSGEFYSLSNNSSETLASEYVTQQPLRSQGRSPHSRRTSNLSSSAARLPESLMMGYAQIQGSFTLDGSLIDLGPFEAVKRKAVVGGQGGGVVGLETPKRDSGLLRGFGWGNLTSSIGELLGAGELSSIKEMRGLANSKSIPLLSTPQSILFVDLQLGPGESRAFEYSFRLPRGLPPTHRGKAMKISYSLVIGTQRPGGAKEQRVKSVDVPFRVLGSVNSHGEILGHDLMAPYILLRDQACVQAVPSAANQQRSTPNAKLPPSPSASSPPPPPPSSSPSSSPSPSATMASFLSYVDDLLSRPQHNPSASLLSPTATPLSPLPSPSSSRRPSSFSVADDNPASAAHHPHGQQQQQPPPPPPSAKEAIDLAILRSNLTGSPAANTATAPNRFEIARNGRRVAVVSLPRPAYRLGEPVTCAVDFDRAEVPCYAVHAALETGETVDPGLALRSEASVARVTRRVWASASEAVLFARRWVFVAVVPPAATPEFVTSGVSLAWKVRLEFVVPVGPAAGGSAAAPAAGVEARTGQGHQHGQGHTHDPDGGYDDDDDNDEERRFGEEREGLTAADLQEKEVKKKKGEKEEVLKGAGAAGGGGVRSHPLLEEISRDERGGTVLVGVENLVCESFEVAVPLRVYGAACNGLERLDRDEAMEEGLPV